MTDMIVLTIPTAAAYRDVASLVLGGVGTRLELSYERTDDLQLAVLSLLDATSGDDASIEIACEDGQLQVSVGPLRDDAPADRGLERVMTRLADRFETSVRDGGCFGTLSLDR